MIIKEPTIMTDQEKIGAATIILEIIANTQPQKTWQETSYNNGGYEPCEVCEKIIAMAAEGLKALQKNENN